MKQSGKMTQGFATRRQPQAVGVGQNANFNIPQGINFTQSAPKHTSMATGKALAKSKLTKTSSPMNMKQKVASRNIDLNAPKTKVKAGDKGRSKSVTQLAKTASRRGVTRLANNKMSPMKSVRSSDKGKSIPVKSKKKAVISLNRQAKSSAVSGLRDVSGLGAGGRGGRYKFTARPTDKA